MPDGFASAAALLPEGLRRPLTEDFREAEELRLRAGRAPTVLLEGRERVFRRERVRAEELLDVLERASRSSLHSVSGELRRGYLTARGGVRVGVCGTAAEGKGPRELSSLAIRVPRQIRDPGDGLCAALAEETGSALLLSPPGGGKTTLLRELVRHASEAGRRVALCDERGEVAALWEGEPQFDVGPCTDVLAGLPKAEAAMTLLRAMNPQVLAMDEITAPEDLAAIESAAGCGVRLLATAHAASAAELGERPLYRRLLGLGVFHTAVLIENRDGRRQYRRVAL